MTYRDVLSIRAFRDLWLGQAISQLGDALYYMTFMFMVKKVTGSDTAVGYVGALETLPFLLIGPYAGVMADRIDRRKLMLWSDVASFLILFALATYVAATGKPPAWMLLATPFLLSTVRAFFMPAKSAAIPALVPTDKVMAANSLSMATQTLMPMLGLAFSAGILSMLYGFSPTGFFVGAISLNGLSFLGSAIYIRRLPPILPDRKAVEEHPWTDFRDGLRYVWRRTDLRVLVPMLTVYRLAIAPFMVAYVAANEKWFDNKPSTLAWLEFIFFAGMVIATPIVGRLKVRQPARWFLVGLCSLGVFVMAMGYSTSFWIFGVFNLLSGLALPPADLPINTYLQLSTPDEYRGRVNSAVSILASGAMPIGYALGGTLLSRAGLTGMFLVMGGGMVLACIYGALQPSFRDVWMPAEASPEKVEVVPLSSQAASLE